MLSRPAALVALFPSGFRPYNRRMPVDGIAVTVLVTIGIYASDPEEAGALTGRFGRLAVIGRGPEVLAWVAFQKKLN